MNNDYPKMKNICFLFPGNYIGGAEKVLFQFIHHLLNQNLGLYVVGPPGDKITMCLNQWNVPYHTIPFHLLRGLKQPLLLPLSILRFIFLVIKLIRFCRIKRINLLYANEIKVALIASIAGKILSIPVVWHVHDFTSHGLIDKFCYYFVTEIIAVSKAVQKRFTCYNNWQTKTTVIYNGVHEEWFEHDDKPAKFLEGLDIPEDGVLIGTAGRFTPEKCQHLFIEIINELSNILSRPVIGLIAGDIGDETLAEYKKKLIHMIKEKNLENNIFLLGYITEMKSFLENIDIFVLPSEREPFGLVTLETMACGKPVIAFQTGGTPEIIEHEITGLLYPWQDWKAMVKGIVHIANTPGLIKTIGLNAKKHVQEKFPLKKNLLELQSTCENLLKQ